jgi:2-C-methyl-D-erythritol 4-phosphate cytidylyltransferase
MSGEVHALLPAAGLGARMGGELPKQYQLLAGRPVLAHTLEALARHPRISAITVLTAAEDHHFDQLGVQLDIPLERVTGGASRAESVRNGLRHLAAGRRPEWVLVHDAARPCLDLASLERLLDQGLACSDGAILAMPVGDTLKRAGPGQRIAATLERSDAWAAQTPQLFPLLALLAALEASLARGDLPTDEAAAMEAAGARPLLVQGAATNIKLTWPEDLLVAESWLSSAGATVPAGGAA